MELKIASHLLEPYHALVTHPDYIAGDDLQHILSQINTYCMEKTCTLSFADGEKIGAQINSPRAFSTEFVVRLRLIQNWHCVLLLWDRNKIVLFGVSRYGL